MFRARMFRVALVAALGLACGCSTPSSCSSCSGSSITSRLTGLFRHGGSSSSEIVGAPIDGPLIADPGMVPGGAPGCTAMPQSFAPPLVPTPRPLLSNEAQRMPYQP